MSILLSSPLSQHAYVTSDFDEALRIFGETYGISRFLELRDYTLQTGPDSSATLHIALAYAGPMQIEVMQPLSGDDHTWRRVLTKPGFQMVFHHECHVLKARREFDDVKAALAKMAFPVLIEGESGGAMHYVYADQTRVIGHVVEYAWYEPEALAALELQIPRF